MDEVAALPTDRRKTSAREIDSEREKIHREILSIVSHDLKTPLATMIGSLEIFTRMGARLAEDKKQSLILSALNEAYRLDGFITNILDMAKLESGMVKIKNEPCDLKNIVRDSIFRLGPKAEHANFDVADLFSLPPAYTDPMLLGRAVGIVLDNAVRYSGATPKVTVKYGNSNHENFIQICDNGPGIPQQRMEEIFSKYSRFSIGDQRPAGTGLGLTICRKIMELLSGSIKASNASEGGAQFTLSFPAEN